MPDPDHPHISSWVPYLSRLVVKSDADTYFVGHSVGCQTILRYVETLGDGVTVGGAVFVAPWLSLKEGSLETPEGVAIADEWLNSQIEIARVSVHLKRLSAVFSDDDQYINLSDSEILRKYLGAKIIVHPKRGHFTEFDGVTEVHAVLNELLNMAKEKR
jgi:predicted alpha/beta hydrolase family esterase